MKSLLQNLKERFKKKPKKVNKYCRAFSRWSGRTHVFKVNYILYNKAHCSDITIGGEAIINLDLWEIEWMSDEEAAVLILEL